MPICREVVNQIVAEDLDGGERQERQHDRGQGHGEHVAEIGARPHPDIFHDVGIGSPSFGDAVRHDIEIGCQQDHVRRFPGHVRRRVDRNADIGRPDRRGVVDPVTDERHRMTSLLQGPDDAQLLVGRHPREQIYRFDPRRERRFAEPSDVAAGHHLFHRQFQCLQQMLADKG